MSKDIEMNKRVVGDIPNDDSTYADCVKIAELIYIINTCPWWNIVKFNKTSKQLVAALDGLDQLEDML